MSLRRSRDGEPSDSRPSCTTRRSSPSAACGCQLPRSCPGAGVLCAYCCRVLTTVADTCQISRGATRPSGSLLHTCCPAVARIFFCWQVTQDCLGERSVVCVEWHQLSIVIRLQDETTWRKDTLGRQQGLGAKQHLIGLLVRRPAIRQGEVVDQRAARPVIPSAKQ